MYSLNNKLTGKSLSVRPVKFKVRTKLSDNIFIFVSSQSNLSFNGPLPGDRPLKIIRKFLQTLSLVNLPEYYEKCPGLKYPLNRLLGSETRLQYLYIPPPFSSVSIKATLTTEDKICKCKPPPHFSFYQNRSCSMISGYGTDITGMIRTGMKNDFWCSVPIFDTDNVIPGV